jgi:hypothetical protein
MARFIQQPDKFQRFVSGDPAGDDEQDVALDRSRAFGHRRAGMTDDR